MCLGVQVEASCNDGYSYEDKGRCGPSGKGHNRCHARDCKSCFKDDSGTDSHGETTSQRVIGSRLIAVRSLARYQKAS